MSTAAPKRANPSVTLARLFSLAGAVRLLCILLLQGFFVSEAQAQGGAVGIRLSDTEVSVDETGTGRTDTYTVRLDSRPTGTIRVIPKSSNQTVATVSPGELIFTADDWDDEQTVTVTGVDDAINNPVYLEHPPDGDRDRGG